MKNAATFCLAAALLTAACVADEEPEAMREMSVVSLRNGRAPPVGATWSFSSSSEVRVGDTRLDSRRIADTVRAAVERELATRGWVRAAPGEYRIAYVAALESPLDGASVSRMFGMDPGISPQFEGQTYDRGTLILDLARNGVAAPIWRGAVQSRASPELSVAVRQQRIERAVNLLVADMLRP